MTYHCLVPALVNIILRVSILDYKSKEDHSTASMFSSRSVCSHPLLVHHKGEVFRHSHEAH